MEITPSQVVAFRKHRRMTQEQMATALGLKRQHYKNYEYRGPIPANIQEKLRVMGLRDEVSGPQYPVPQILVPIPYLGRISASSMVNWTNPLDSLDWADVPPEFAGKGRACCTVDSDSCYPLLWPEDKAVWQIDAAQRIGSVVLFMSGEGEDCRVTIKQLKHDSARFFLHPLNRSYQDEYIEGQVVGYLVGFIRQTGSTRYSAYDPNGLHTLSFLPGLDTSVQI